MTTNDCVVGVFGSLPDAREAVAALEHEGWDQRHVSLITRSNESELDAARLLEQGEQMEQTAAVGAAVGATLGLLASSSLLIVPGIGPVVFVGAMASGITGGLVGGIVGGMSGWGLKHDHVRRYERELRDGKTLVLAIGDPLQLAEIEAALERSPAERVTLHAETANSTVDK